MLSAGRMVVSLMFSTVLLTPSRMVSSRGQTRQKLLTVGLLAVPDDLDDEGNLMPTSTLKPRG